MCEPAVVRTSSVANMSLTPSARPSSGRAQGNPHTTGGRNTPVVHRRGTSGCLLVLFRGRTCFGQCFAQPLDILGSRCARPRMVEEDGGISRERLIPPPWAPQRNRPAPPAHS